jgi:hypothetical protein
MSAPCDELEESSNAEPRSAITAILPALVCGAAAHVSIDRAYHWFFIAPEREREEKERRGKTMSATDDEATHFLRMAIYDDATSYTTATEAWTLANTGDLNGYLYWRACILNRELDGTPSAHEPPHEVPDTSSVFSASASV